MPRTYFPTPMYRYGVMQKAGGSGSSRTYALKGNGTNLSAAMALNNTLAIGDSSKITFRNTAGADPTNNRVLQDGVSGVARGNIAQINTTNIISWTDVGVMKLDDVIIANNTVQYPTDGLTHTLEHVPAAAMNTGTFFADFAGGQFSLSTILEYRSNTAARGLEIWPFNTLSLIDIKETNLGTGQDIILTNVTPSDWVAL